MRTCFVFLLSLLFNLVMYAQPAKAQSPDSILSTVAQKLNSIKTMSYFYSTELNYPSERYLYKHGWNVYLDFGATDTVLGFRFQTEDSAGKEVYNGKEKFVLVTREKTIDIDSTPSLRRLENHGALHNSLITLRNALPLIIGDTGSDKKLSDTLINGIACTIVAVNVHRRWIPPLGKQFNAMTIQKNWTYSIIIDQNTWLPIELLQTSDVNSDIMRTVFSEIRIDPPPPADSSWLMATYMTEYKVPDPVEEPILASAGSVAIPWKLQHYKNAQKVSLADFRGKVVLMDFWWKNCGPCIESTPHLVALKNKFKGKSFDIASINFMPSDTRDDIAWYSNKNKINYPVLINGKAVADSYGVNAAPTFFLINKKGEIIYAKVGFDKAVMEEIEKLIEENL